MTQLGKGMPTSRRMALKILARPRRQAHLAAAPSAADPIKIGLSAAFSGPNAAAGQALQRGAELAMEEINGTGGVLGRQMTLVIRDNEHKLDRGVAQTRELIEREGCVGDPGLTGQLHRPRRDRHDPRAEGAVVRPCGRRRRHHREQPLAQLHVPRRHQRPRGGEVPGELWAEVGRHEVRDPQRGHRVGRARHRRPAGSAQGEEPGGCLGRQDESRRQRLHPADAARQEREAPTPSCPTRTPSRWRTR